MKFFLLLTPMGAITLFSGETAMAQVHAGDIILGLDAGSITTGGTDAMGAIVPGIRVFAATFGESPNFTNDPGMDCPDGTFPSLSQIGFRIRAALRKWDGSKFADIPPEVIEVRFGPLGPVDTPLTDSVVVGFSMAVSSTGKFHHHPGFTLLPGAGRASPDDGIYLYETDLFSNVSSIGSSQSFWLVFNQNEPVSEHQAALDWTYTRKVCRADFNLDRVVDFFDYLDFVDAFSAGLSAADVNDDQIVDFFDYLDFVDAFSVGCSN